MKVAVPVTMDDSNVTSNAVDENYPVWGEIGPKTTIRSGFYASAVWENPVTLDLYAVVASPQKNAIYRKLAAESFFTVIKTFADFTTNGFDGIAGDPALGLIYVWGSDNTDIGYVFSYAPATGLDVEIYYTSVGVPIQGFAVNSLDHSLYLYDNEIKRREYGAEAFVSFSTDFPDGIESIAVNPITGNIYVAVEDPGDEHTIIYRQQPEESYFSEIGDLGTGLSSRLYVDTLTNDVWVGRSTSIYRQTAGTGAFAAVVVSPAITLKGVSSVTGYLFGRFSYDLVYCPQNRWFAEGEYCVYDASVYRSRVDNNAAEPGTDATKWYRYSAVNHLKMFDGSVESKTTATGSMTITIEAANVSALAFFGVLAETLSVTLTVDAVEVFSETKTLRSSEVGDWYEYFFEPINQIKTTVFTDIPAYGTGTFEIVFTGSSVSDPVECALCVGGYAYDIGATKRNVKPRIVSYSTQTTDAFGRMTFVQRSSAKRVEGDAFVSSRAEFQRIFDLMDQIRDTPCLWLVSRDLDTWSIIHGVYQKFDPVVNDSNGSYSFEILEVL